MEVGVCELGALALATTDSVMVRVEDMEMNEIVGAADADAVAVSALDTDASADADARSVAETMGLEDAGADSAESAVRVLS